MDISQAVFEIGDKQISVYECPVLVCKGCGKKQVGHRVISLIYSTYWDFENHPGDKSCKLTLNGNGRFEYAKDAIFLYDSRDLNIPGCDVDLDPGHADGFSLPVYFDRKVLNNFYTDEEYELDFFLKAMVILQGAGAMVGHMSGKFLLGLMRMTKSLCF